jgi:isopentenyl diphosphate isomerase/L-lactate dehydrogenase-like FMN-dependent dehydrogenase
MIRAQAAQDSDLIASAKDALNVFDFEAVARKNLPPAHWGYMASGSDDDATIAANREGFTRYQLRMRRLVDVSRLDTSVQLFGAKLDNPIVLCPVGGQRMFHRDGEIAVARAARSKKHLQVLSTVGTASIEEVSAERGEPVWFQLYQRNDWGLTRQMLKRAEAAGCPALVFTIDLLGGRNPETYQRSLRRDTRQCGACHDPAPLVDNRRRPMLADLVAPATPSPEVGTPTWDYVKRLKDATGMKLLLKGIVTREDAELAIKHGVDGLFVSNHGGRAENSLRSTIECVPEVVAGVAGRVPVIVDSGFRRGTDIFKALALGATAVGVGRPYVWGLSAFGQEGVEAVLDILQRELQLVMRQAGTTTIKQITRAHVVERRV